MTRWIIACAGAWLICVAGFFAIWVVGLYLHCIFTSGCLYLLDIQDILGAVNYKGVMIKGTLSALAIVGIVWFKRRSR